jgi:hypothetical protein
MKARRSIAALILFSLLTIIGYLEKIGVVYVIAFSLVFGISDFLALTIIKKGFENIYGKSRAINIFVYGFGSVVLLIFILMLLGYK